MTAKVKEISDGGSDPVCPTIEARRESQRLGSVGTGTQSQSYAAMEQQFNMGTGEGGDGKPDFSTNNSDYNPWPSDQSSKMPWE